MMMIMMNNNNVPISSETSKQNIMFGFFGEI